MKKLSFLMSVACIALFASCSTDSDELVAENTSSKLCISVSMPDNNDTRIKFQNNDLLNLVWGTIYDSNDCIQLATPSGSGNVFLDMDPADAGKITAKFPISEYYANQIKDNVTYTFYNSETIVKYGGGIDYKYLKQNQPTFNDMSQIPYNIVLSSESYTGAQIKAGVNVSLKHQSSILKLNVKSLPADFDGLKTFDFSICANYEGNSSDELANITVNEALDVTRDSNMLYIAFDPAKDLGAGKKLAVKIKSGTSQATAYVVSQNGKNYEPGIIYTATLDFNNPGKWTWEQIKKPYYHALFEGTSDNMSNTDWTATAGWNFGNQLKWDYGHWIYGIYGYAYGPDQNNIDYTLISPTIKLLSDNTIELNHNFSMSNYNLGTYSYDEVPMAVKQKAIKILVRTVEGSGTSVTYGEWTPVIGQIIINEAKLTNQQFTSSGMLKIDSSFNGKDVQIGLQFNKGEEETCSWYVHDVMLRGV